MLKALVVDDEKTTREVLVNFLPWSALGISEVKEAGDGLSALRVASEFNPDLVLSDIRMPKMNGIELAESLQRRLPDCKFIFLSGYSDKEYLKSAIRLKAVNYVEKPVNLEEISEALKTAVAESIRAKESLRSSLPALKQKLCLSLIEKHPDTENSNIAIQFPEFELPEDSTYISALLWVLPEKKEADMPLKTFKDEIDKIIHNVFHSVCERYLAAFKGDEYVIILYKTDCIYGKDYFISMINKLRLLIKDSCEGVKAVLAGIGCEVTGKENIYSSFQKSVIAQKRCFFTGDINVFANDDSPPYTFDENKLTEFSENLKAGKKDEAVIFIKRLRNDLQKHPNTHSDNVKRIFTDILLILIRFTEDRNLFTLKNSPASPLECINNAATLDEIADNVTSLIEMIFAEIEKENGDKSIVSRVTAYIQENYYDEQISIRSISKKMYLTPNYLSLLFKKETGKTINQYITEVRIDNAKKYLKDCNAKLNKVAKNVGYGDAKYFSKVFEKMVGIKPKEYREKHCSENQFK